jgi:hypothetical protein
VKSKINILKKESKNLAGMLENEISALVLFIFHGNENFVFEEIFPFEFPEPKLGGIKEEDFTPAGHLHDYSPREIKETLENSELKMEVSAEKLLESINVLERTGYIEETGMSRGKAERRYVITEKGYMLARFLGYSMQYPGQNKRQKRDRQF